MEYHLHYADRVKLYLREREGITRQGRIRLFTSLNRELRQVTDARRLDPSMRVKTDSPCFWYEIIFGDEGGGLHHFWFAVNDSSATYGVLRIEYVEDRVPPPS